MLSYAEHRKFCNPIQAPTPFLSFPARGAERKKDERRCLAPVATDFANVPQFKWIMGRAFAQWPIMAPSPQSALRSAK